MLSSAAFAWGSEGHRIAADVANALLTDAARAELHALIGTEDLSQIATYLDDHREELEARTRGSSRWHYENREVCGRDAGVPQCPGNNCVTRQSERFIQVLKDRHAHAQQRAEAIRALVHLIADLHQPLHLVDNHDRGGNDVFVWLPREREPRRLHEVWDTQFVRWNANRRSDATYARALSEQFQSQRANWEQGNIARWADETYALGKHFAYEQLPGFGCSLRQSQTILLSPEYIRDARKIAAEQLAKAGMRIAHVLNTALRP